jgi:hypothetical protein
MSAVPPKTGVTEPSLLEKVGERVAAAAYDAKAGVKETFGYDAKEDRAQAEIRRGKVENTQAGSQQTGSQVQQIESQIPLPTLNEHDLPVRDVILPEMGGLPTAEVQEAIAEVLAHKKLDKDAKDTIVVIPGETKEEVVRNLENAKLSTSEKKELPIMERDVPITKPDVPLWKSDVPTKPLGGN